MDVNSIAKKNNALPWMFTALEFDHKNIEGFCIMPNYIYNAV
jgi:hypothetical protein